MILIYIYKTNNITTNYLPYTTNNNNFNEYSSTYPSTVKI